MRLTGVAVTDSEDKDDEMWERIGGFPGSLGGASLTVGLEGSSLKKRSPICKSPNHPNPNNKRKRKGPQD